MKGYFFVLVILCGIMFFLIDSWENDDNDDPE